MFKCTGSCSACRRCKNSEFIESANARKTRLSIYPGDFASDSGMTGFGVALDIGTTTVVGMLWDMKRGAILETQAQTNPQNKVGMDVVSRINFCIEDESNLFKLRNEISSCINDIIAKLCQKAQIDSTDIIKMTICGNTAMSHIVAGRSLKTLAAAPFIPEYEGTLELKASDLRIKINESARIILIPNIAGHVGGDITAGAVAARILEKNKLILYIDIGTNGEIVLTDGAQSYACSTAAGPAFEGASIYDGMRAVDGAIEDILIKDGDVLFKTIGGLPPQGICGSGVIDAVAQMLDSGIIDKSGRILSAEQAKAEGISDGLQERLVETDGKRQFVLVAKENDEDIVITQHDIREVQLAKGAIAAGVEVLLTKMNRCPEDIEQICIAGAFGNYINKHSAVRIGLLPDIGEEKIELAGNAAGTGVSMALVSEREMDTMRSLPRIIQHVELASHSDFQIAYMEAMGFM